MNVMPTSSWRAFSSICSALAELRVEGAERLVEQEDGRVQDQRARQRDALLLAAGELAGAALLEAGQLHQLEGLAHPLA